MSEKRCSKCGEVKPVTEFYKRTDQNGKFSSQCRVCVVARTTVYYSTHKEICLEKSKKWYQANKEHHHSLAKAWAKSHVDALREYKRAAEKKRWATDPMKRLSSGVSRGIYKAIRENKHGLSWSKLVGFTLDDLKHRLESLFQPGMTWENYGEWHVDHIRPIASFEIRSHEDEGFKKCWALDNLQPLWAVENLKKGAKWGTK